MAESFQIDAPFKPKNYNPDGSPAGSVDPFAAMGGGVYANGGWRPANNPGPSSTPAPISPTAPPAAAPASSDYPSLPPGATPPPGYYDPASGKTAPGGTAAATPATTTPAATPATPATTPGTPAVPTTVNDAFKQALLQQLTKPIGVDPNDPVIKAQTDAYSLAQTRAAQRNREEMAGRAAATGQLSDLGSGGGFDQALTNLQQQQGESEAGFNANLTGQELTKQRDDLYRYMALAGNQLNAEDQRALTDKLAQLDAQIRREGIAQQGALGQGQLANQTAATQGNLNLGLLQLLTGNQQFGQNLGAQLGMFNSGQDTSNFWKALGLG